MPHALCHVPDGQTVKRFTLRAVPEDIARIRSTRAALRTIGLVAGSDADAWRFALQKLAEALAALPSDFRCTDPSEFKLGLVRA